MSVMACGRRGCEQIMCDRCILDNTAYICGDCYDELCEWKKTWPKAMPAAEVRQRIVNFMRSRAGEHRTILGSEIEDEFRRLTDD
jgi:hypothetical protein